jgi:hypothetical protein
LGRRINNTYLEKNWRRKPAMAVLGTRKEAGPGTGAFLITNLTWETIRDPLLLALRGSPDGWWENPQREEKRGTRSPFLSRNKKAVWTPGPGSDLTRTSPFLQLRSPTCPHHT